MSSGGAACCLLPWLFWMDEWMGHGWMDCCLQRPTDIHMLTCAAHSCTCLRAPEVMTRPVKNSPDDGKTGAPLDASQTPKAEATAEKVPAAPQAGAKRDPLESLIQDPSGCYGSAADIWGLGVLAYQVLVGHPFCHGGLPRHTNIKGGQFSKEAGVLIARKLLACGGDMPLKFPEW